MAIDQRTSIRLFCAGLSTFAALGMAWWWWSSRAPVESVEMVDRGADFDALLEERAAQGAESPADPRELVMSVEDRAEWVARLGDAQAGRMRDPLCFYRLLPDIDRRQRFEEHPGGGYPVRTNSLGLRNDAELMEPAAELRILVTGDSHTEGACANDESFTARLADDLHAARPGVSVEALNAGVGGYHLYHYLGVLERHIGLAPRVFVVAVYGGNDFSGAMKMQRFFRRRKNGKKKPWNIGRFHQAGIEGSGFEPQQLKQLEYFLDNPQEVPLAIDTTIAISARILELCEAAGIAPLFVYIPPAILGQPDLYPQEAAALRRILAEAGVDAEPSDTIANGWTAWLREQGVALLDLREPFRASPDPLYWRSDSHVNLRGHRKIAELAAPLILDLIETPALAPR